MESLQEVKKFLGRKYKTSTYDPETSTSEIKYWNSYSDALEYAKSTQSNNKGGKANVYYINSIICINCVNSICMSCAVYYHWLRHARISDNIRSSGSNCNNN